MLFLACSYKLRCNKKCSAVSFTLQLSQSGESEVPALWLSSLNIESWSSNLIDSAAAVPSSVPVVRICCKQHTTHLIHKPSLQILLYWLAVKPPQLAWNHCLQQSQEIQESCFVLLVTFNETLALNFSKYNKSQTGVSFYTETFRLNRHGVHRNWIMYLRIRKK